MKLLLGIALMICVISVIFQSDSSFAKAIDSLPSPGTQGHMPRTSPGSDVYQITDKDDGDSCLQESPFRHRSDFSTHCDHLSGDSQPTGNTQLCTLEGDSANCSGLYLGHVPRDLPVSIRLLDVANNCLRNLANYTFARYSSLEYLNLSFNDMVSFENDTFYNLSKLKELNLSHNKLCYTFSSDYQPHVFRPLESLTSLELSWNNEKIFYPAQQYPDTALSYLTNLESLSLYCLLMNYPVPAFGAGFKNLTELTTLSIKDDIIYSLHLGGLNNHSFENLETLESLTISGCDIQGHSISGTPFHNLKKLQELDVSGNPNIGFQYLRPIFDGLYHLENLTELSLGSIVDRYSLSQCLDITIFENFPRHLTKLKVSENNIEAVEEDVIGLLPVNLTTLDLSGNQFIIEVYLQHLNELEHLTTLYMNGYSTQHALPDVYPHSRYRVPTRNCKTRTDILTPFVISLPPKLATVEMNNAGLNFDWKGLKIETTALMHLSASGNQFYTLRGPVHGFSTLIYMDLSMCAVQKICSRFFDDFSSLQVLRLDGNALGDFLSDSNHEKVFDSLADLKVLNLTNNAISVLQPGLFKNLYNLTSLYLRKNPFVSFDADPTAAIALSTLDLAHTHVFTLSQEIQTYFDNLTKNAGVNVSIYMEFTPISCRCPNLQFLQWMTTSQAFSKPFRHFYCDFVYFQNLSVKDDYEETMTILRRQCASNALLLFLVISATLALSSLIIGGIVYRFRWNIRYLYYAVYLRFKKNSNVAENARDFDAFICYASEDAEFAEGILDRELSDRGLRIFLHGRDFKAGDYVSSNIVNAVCSSRKTVVLLTEALLDSYWCGYEIEMAKLEGIHIGRPVLIFVFLEDIPKRKLSRDLLYNIKNNTYVEYMESPSDPDQMRLWWDKLANDIKD